MTETTDNRPDGSAARHIVILGAGIAGLAAADRLSKAGFEVTVIESGERCGGTHRSVNIGPYTFDIGSIFYDHTSPLMQLAEGLTDICPKVVRHQRRIAPSGRLMHYPMAPSELFKASPGRLLLGIADLLLSRLFVRADGSLAAICRKRMGGRIFRETGLEAYITRFHHTHPEQIDEQFFYYRMAFVEQSTRLMVMAKRAFRAIPIGRKRAPKQRVPLFIRPYDGMDAMFVPIRQRLEQAGVRFVFGHSLTGVERQGEGFVVSARPHDENRAGEQGASAQFPADCVLNTIPLATLYSLLFGEPAGLTSVDMTTLFVSSTGLDERSGNVLFNFDHRGAWKRATIYSRLYPQAPTQRDFFSVEVTIPRGGKHDPEAAFADFKAHFESCGMAQDLKLEGSFFLPDCYPLYTTDSHAIAAAAIERVRQTGIIPLGRQGRFEYLPTATQVLRRVWQELEGGGLGNAASSLTKPHKADASQ